MFKQKTNLHISKKPYTLYKNRQIGEQELFMLAMKARHEGSWAHILGCDIWINLTSDYHEEISSNEVKYKVKMRPLQNSVFDRGLLFYHIHPKAAFDATLEKMKKIKRQRKLCPGIGNIFDTPEYVPYGHLLSTFHLPSVQDIETASTLEEKHGPGLHHIIISNTGVSITRIRNPPETEKEKLPIKKITDIYEGIYNIFSKYNPNSEYLINPYYGLINKEANNYIQVVDLTSITSIHLNGLEHTLMRWLSTDKPIDKQLGDSGIMHLMQLFGNDPELSANYEKIVNDIAKAKNNSRELEKITKDIHHKCSQAFARFVDEDSKDIYASFQINCLRDFYKSIDRHHLKRN